MKHKSIMKHLLSACLCTTLVLICLFSIAVNADAATIIDSGICGENVTWILDSEGMLTISGNGAITNSTWDSSSVNSVVIKSGITSIGEAVFWNCSNLVSVIIGNSVVSIGEWAFSDLGNLTSVTMGNSVISIGEGAFDNCECLTSIMLPESIISIGSSAFFDCSSLTSIIIPDSVITIGISAFNGCRNLTSVTIGKNVTSIGEYAFSNCSSLTSITIPDNIASIGNYMFSNCSNLSSIIIPDSVTSIGASSFFNCSSLTSIMIPDSVITIGISAFNGCRNLTSVTIGKNITSIGECAFYNCNGLNSIIIPDNVTHISNRAFMNCSSLVSVTIGDSVTSIGNQAFDTCECLTTITIPDSVTSIGGLAFSECKSLTSVIIGKNVISIGEWTFDCCDNLKEIYFKGDAPSIDSSAFYDVTATAYYPIDNSTWTEIVMQNYDGTIIWVARCSDTHQYVNTIIAPDCTTAGCTEYTCSTCGDSYEADHTAALGHIYEEGVCSVCGDLTLFVKKQPDTLFVKNGSAATFSVDAIGDELTYQWQYRTSSSGSWKNVSTASGKTASYSLTVATKHHGYQYRCKVTDSAGYYVYANTVTLNVLGIKTQPTTQKVKAGATAKFTVSATGANETYQWQYKTSSTGSWKNVSAVSGKTANYSMTAQSRHNGYYYRCRVKDSAGNTVYTKTVRLFVLAINTQPVSKTVVAGKTAKFTVSATGNGLKYQWYYRTSSTGSWKTMSAASGKTASYSLTAAARHHGYQYRCKITDSAGNTVYTETVSLYVLGIKTQPASKSVKVGTTAKFTVSAVGKGLKYQWYYRTSSSGSWKSIAAASGKTANYSLTAQSRHNGYQYRCKITDSAGNVLYTNIVQLTVKK